MTCFDRLIALKSQIREEVVMNSLRTLLAMGEWIRHLKQRVGPFEAIRVNKNGVGQTAIGRWVQDEICPESSCWIRENKCARVALSAIQKIWMEEIFEHKIFNGVSVVISVN